MKKTIFPLLTCSLVCFIGFLTLASAQPTLKKNEKPNSFSLDRVKLMPHGGVIRDIKFEDRLFLVITKYGGTLTVDGELVEKKEYEGFFKQYDTPTKAIVLQIRNDKETSVAAAFSTVKDVISSLPATFKGRVYLCSSVF